MTATIEVIERWPAPGGLFHFRRTDIDPRGQSSQLAEFGGRGMSFNICRGTLGSLAMFHVGENREG